MSNGILDISADCLREFADFMTGKKVGSGSTRSVYQHPFDPGKVIKVEDSATTFQNVTEWKIWQDFSHVKGVKEWLAPCHAISHSGTFLIMEKAVDLPPGKIPEKLPYFLTDHKPENFGVIGKRIVCRDYGHVILGLETKMRKWRGA